MKKITAKKACQIFDNAYQLILTQLHLKNPRYHRPTLESFTLYLRPYSDPEVRHNEWVENMIEDDWKYFTTFVQENKQSPLIILYSDLPREVKIRETMLNQYVLALKKLNMLK